MIRSKTKTRHESTPRLLALSLHDDPPDLWTKATNELVAHHEGSSLCGKGADSLSLIPEPLCIPR